MIKLLPVTASLVFLVICTIPPSAFAGPTDKLRVTRADYKAIHGDGIEKVSTLRAVQHDCDGAHECNIFVDNNWFNNKDPKHEFADPAVGQKKNLEVEYNCDPGINVGIVPTTDATKDADEGERLRLTCD